jgi:fructokinase
VAVGLARLGQDVTFLTRLGDDPDGALIETQLRTNGVHLRLHSDGAGTSRAVASLAADGSAGYSFDLIWTLNHEHARFVLADVSPPALHVGSVAALCEPGATVVRELVRAARPRSTISYDPNYRPALLTDTGAARRQVEDLVASSDVVKASDADIEWLYPDQELTTVATRWLGTGPALVVVTRGAAGAWAVNAAGSVGARGVDVLVADTVGAGDSFMSALLDGLARRDLLGAAARGRLAALDAGEVAALLHEAVVASAITCSRPGANPPGRGVLDSALAALPR